MRKILSALSLVMLSTMLLANVSFAGNEDILFISTTEELAAAEQQTDSLSGLAVNINFYQHSRQETRLHIDGLVKYVISLEQRPVFLYGQPFDQELAKRLLVANGEFEDGSNCTPTVFAGLVLTKTGSIVSLCGADDQPLSEAGFRKWLIPYSKNVIEFLRK